MRFVPNPRATRQLAADSSVRRVVEGVAKDAAQNAARLAPHDTGRLARSVGYKVEKSGDGWVGVVFFGEWYGKLWEFGHRGRRRPFLRPGVQQAIAKRRGRWRSE